MTEIEIVLTTDSSFWARLARRLGLATWTHAMLRFPWAADLDYPSTHHYRVIEASGSGVVERPWNPEEYLSYAAYKLKSLAAPHADYDQMLAYAKGQVGKRYAYGWLMLIAYRLLRSRFKFTVMGIGGGIIGRGQVCSSLVDDVYSYGGFDLVPERETPLVLPDEIAKSALLEKA